MVACLTLVFHPLPSSGWMCLWDRAALLQILCDLCPHNGNQGVEAKCFLANCRFPLITTMVRLILKMLADSLAQMRRHDTYFLHLLRAQSWADSELTRMHRGPQHMSKRELPVLSDRPSCPGVQAIVLQRVLSPQKRGLRRLSPRTDCLPRHRS
jgi:hypothetical protein